MVHFNISPTSRDDQDQSGQITGKCKSPSWYRTNVEDMKPFSKYRSSKENALWVKRVKSRVGQVRTVLDYPRHVGFSFKVCFYFMCMFVFVYICAPCACLVSMETGRGHWVPQIRVVDGCELPCECWDPNRSLLQEQQMHSTVKPSLGPWKWGVLNRSKQRLKP